VRASVRRLRAEASYFKVAERFIHEAEAAAQAPDLFSLLDAAPGAA
jgi:hypothetical protein